MNKSPKQKLKLRHLFWAMALVASGLGVSIAMIFWTSLVIAYWVLKFRMATGRNFLLAFLLLCSLVALLLPAVAQVRDAARMTQCMNNMRQILLAIHNYEAANGRLPCDTTTINDKGEQIRTSWRARILPYLDSGSGFFQYRSFESWDSPNNAAIQTRFADSVFQCPSHKTGSRTPYKLVVGKGTAFELNGKVAFADCEDSQDFTVALVEDIENPVEIFEPEDLTVAEAVELFNNSSKENAAHIRDNFYTVEYVGFHFGLLDGSLHRWPANPDGQIDERAFMVADGNPENLAVYGNGLREIKWGRVVSLAIFVALCFWPRFWLREIKIKTQCHEIEEAGQVPHL